MRPGDIKRLEQLEARMGARRGGGGLQPEIDEMGPEERGQLRQFLEYAVRGGQPGEAEYQRLKTIAEDAIRAARARL